jgi:hypothetical protein
MRHKSRPCGQPDHETLRPPRPEGASGGYGEDSVLTLSLTDSANERAEYIHPVHTRNMPSIKPATAEFASEHHRQSNQE